MGSIQLLDVASSIVSRAEQSRTLPYVLVPKESLSAAQLVRSFVEPLLSFREQCSAWANRFPPREKLDVILQVWTTNFLRTSAFFWYSGTSRTF